MEVDSHVQSLIANLQQQLADILRESCSPKPAQLSPFQQARPPQGVLTDDSGIISEDNGERRGATAASLLLRLNHISEMVKEVSRDLGIQGYRNESRERRQEQERRAAVIVLGPPGTEPQRGVTEGRFDHFESPVYTRSTVQVPLSHCPLHIEAVPPKDAPLRTAEVYSLFTEDDDFANRRWTRSGTRAIQMPSKRAIYAENSSDSSENSFKDEYLPKSHPPKKPAKKQPREQKGDLALPHHPASTAVSTSNRLPSSSEEDYPSESNADLSPPEVGSDGISSDLGPPLAQPISSSSPRDLCSPMSTSSEYETASETITGLQDVVGCGKDVDEEEMEIVTSTGREISPSSSISSSSSTRPHSSRVYPHSSGTTRARSSSSSSGIYTVFSDLQCSFASMKKKKPLSLHSVRKKSKPKRYQQPSNFQIRSCSVVVEKLPQRAVEKCVGKIKREVEHSESVTVSTASSKLSAEIQRTLKKPVTPVMKSKALFQTEWSSDSDFENRTPLGSRDEDGGVSLSGKSREEKGGVGEGSRKVDKHYKSSKGKEKAAAAGSLRVENRLEGEGVTLPDIIECTACGCRIRWRSDLIHEHQRLHVLICQRCWENYNKGTFVVEEGNEIYCTLCGDGGDIVCCDHCDKSFCRDCISRISGRKSLEKLLTTDWSCYMCDPSPLSHQKTLYENLLKYFKHRKKSSVKRSLDFRSDSVLGHRGNFDSDDTTDCERGQLLETNVSTTGMRECAISSAGGDGQDQTSGGEQREEESGSKHEGKKQKSGESTKKGGGRVQSNPRGRRWGLVWDDSDSDSSSGEDRDSPEVHTDEVSMSDSDLFDGEFSFKRKKKRKNKEGGGNPSKNSGNLPSDPSDPSEEGGNEADKRESRASSTTSSGSSVALLAPSGKRKNKSLRKPILENNSDFEDFQPFSQSKSKKRSLSISSGEGNGKPPANPQKKARKSHLADFLSSSSDSEDESSKKSQHLRIQLSASDMEDSSNGRMSPTLTPFPKKVTYAIRKASSGSSSDSDYSFLQRKKKKNARQTLGSESSRSSRGGSSTSTEQTPKLKKVLRRRGLSSDDDFEDRDLSLRGPRLKRKQAKRALWGSDSESSGSREKEEGQKSERESERGSEKESGRESEKDSDVEEISPEKSTPGRKRRKIRKLITKEKLREQTKAAQKQERERMERLKKRSRLSTEGENLERLILEEDAETVKVEVRESLVKSIKPHQRDGIKFLYDACIENLERWKAGERRGAILAHCMGLGKSLQVIAFLDALLNLEESEVSRVLILSPVNTIYNWRNEFELWIPYSEIDYYVYLLTDSDVRQRYKKMKRWFEGGGILFSGYEMFRNLAQGKKMKNPKKDAFKQFLLDPGPDIIVCDEGHVMRNSKSSLSLILNQIKTRCRIVLTGTPLQNNLLEYYTMVSFVKPNLLGNQREFTNRFANPIKNGQCQDSMPHDVRLMKQRAHILHELLSGSVQRRDYRVLAECLPPKQEYVLSIRMSDVQDQLYRKYLDKSSGYHTASDLFSTFSALQKVWNHPWVLKLDEIRKAEKAALDFEDSDEGNDDSLGGFIVSEGSDVERLEKAMRKKNKKKAGRRSSLTSGSRSSSVCSSRPLSVASNSRANTPAIDNDVIIIEDSDNSTPPPSTDHTYTNGAALRESNPIVVKSEQSPDGLLHVTSGSPTLPSTPQAWYNDILTDDCEGKIELGGKLLFLLELLKEAEKLKEKVLVFTQSLLTLNLIEDFLGRPEYGEWTPGLDYYRLDGSIRPDMRTYRMGEFNDKNNDRMRLFLISTRAGSLGVNLVAANRVVIFDACWNPSHDLQAVFRTYRFGQTKPIFVYRLLAQGTMEEKIYDRQVTKQSLSMRVVDEKQIGRHYTHSDLAELFTYTPAPPPPPPGSQPKKPSERPEADLVLCSILDRMHPQWIVGYHEHNSLLEHIFDEELSEEERKAAWEKYKADMAAESQRYNFEALQSRLEEEQQRQLAAASTSAVAMPGPGMTMPVSEPMTIIAELMAAIRCVKHLQVSQFRKHQLSYILRQHGENTPLHVKTELVSVNHMMRVDYSKVTQSIQDINAKLSDLYARKVTVPLGIQSEINLRRSTLLLEMENFQKISAHPLQVAPHPPHSSAGPSHLQQHTFRHPFPPHLTGHQQH